MAYWSTDFQESILQYGYGYMSCLKEALVTRMQSLITRKSCLEGKRSMEHKQERYIMLIRFCIPLVFCYMACNVLRLIRFLKLPIPY